MKEVKSPGALDGYDILAQAVVEQNPKGKVNIHEPWRGSRWLAIGDGGIRKPRLLLAILRP